MLKMMLLVNLISIMLLATVSGSFLFQSFMLSVSKYYKKQLYYQNEDESNTVLSTNLFDEYGDIPSVKEAYEEIIRAKQIAVLRTSNSTIIGYQLDSSISERLEYSIGCKPFYMLQSPRHHILVTGIVADCRSVVRVTKQIVLNHTVEYASFPSGDYIAQKLGDYLQSYTASSSKPLACHTFIIDSGYRKEKLVSGIRIANTSTSSSSNNNSVSFQDEATSIPDSSHSPDHFDQNYPMNTMGKVYEVSVIGNYWEVLSGTAGHHMIEGKQLLQKEYSIDIFQSQQKALELLNQIFNHTHTEDNDDRGDDDKENESIVNKDNIYQYIILPDVYID